MSPWELVKVKISSAINSCQIEGSAWCQYYSLMNSSLSESCFIFLFQGKRYITMQEQRKKNARPGLPPPEKDSYHVYPWNVFIVLILK